LSGTVCQIKGIGFNIGPKASNREHLKFLKKALAQKASSDILCAPFRLNKPDGQQLLQTDN